MENVSENRSKMLGGQDFSKILHTPSEYPVAVLGGDYIRNWIVSGDVENGFCLVSDKRVYFKGKCYYLKKGLPVKRTEERTVDLKNITGSGFIMAYDFKYLIYALPFLILHLIINYSIDNHNTLTQAFFHELFRGKIMEASALLFLFIPFMIAVANIVMFFLKKMRLYSIEYAGGKVAFLASNYSEKEIADFQTALRATKDAIEEHGYNNNIEIHTQAATPTVNASDEIMKYKSMLDNGIITEEEFTQLKSKLIRQ